MKKSSELLFFIQIVIQSNINGDKDNYMKLTKCCGMKSSKL